MVLCHEIGAVILNIKWILVSHRVIYKSYPMSRVLEQKVNPREGGGGGTCYVGVSGDAPFSWVYFCSKTLVQGIKFEDKF